MPKPKFRNTDSEEIVEARGLKERLQRLEREERFKLNDDSFTVVPMVMNLMVQLCEAGAEPVRVFNWLKNVTDVTKAEGGPVRIHFAKRFHAARIFDVLDFELKRRFRAPIEAVYAGQVLSSVPGPSKAAA